MGRNNSIPIASSNKGKELMIMATKILEELDVDQVFKVTKNLQYTGYRPKNPQQGFDSYLLIFSQQEYFLSISIDKNFLEPYVLTLAYWGYDEYSYLAGRFWVLPTQQDIFLDSLHRNYWNLLEIERKTVGTIYLNEIERDEWGYSVLPSVILDEFNPNTLSNSDSYLVVLDEDKLFPYTYQVCISSSTVLQEFFSYFGQILLNTFVDDIPF